MEIIINIPVLNETYYKCLYINQNICKINGNLIKFNSFDNVFPHITLKMGKVKDNNISNIIKVLEDYFINKYKMEFNTTDVILKEPNNKYYFVEIDDDRLMKISSDLDELLRDFMEDSEFVFSKNNLHHITLGRRHSDDEKVANVDLLNVGKVFADRIYVSLKGKYGVCLNILKVINLN